MEHVLLQIKRKRERRKLEDWLASKHHIVLPDQQNPFEGEFDIALIDGASLRELGRAVRARRKAEEPVLLPFLLVTTRRQGSLPARHLGRLVDDVILRPLQENELQARVANLLR